MNTFMFVVVSVYKEKDFFYRYELDLYKIKTKHNIEFYLY